MNKLIDVVKLLPEMKTGTELIKAMSVFPEYNEDVVNENQAVRLMALSELYNLYIPSQMSIEIYSRLYLALTRSLQKKGTKLAIKQQNENFMAIQRQEYTGIMGGSDSFTIIGASGIGKSSAISRAMTLITANQAIQVDEPYTKIIPCVVVQCPFDSSVKGLLLEILRKVDDCLDSKYYTNALRARATTDMLIGSVSQVALNHIGMLIVDEIQNVVNSKNGKSLVGVLTQLINNSGISICMVGTPESSVFFEQAMQLARRSLGLQYGALEYGADFAQICKLLFVYQYVKNQNQITDAIIEWLYEHSGGIISIVVSLIHDAQEIAIITGKEVLNLDTLNEAYKKRLSMLHGFIEPNIKKNKKSSSAKKKSVAKECLHDNSNLIENNITTVTNSIAELVNKSKRENKNIVELLKLNFCVSEVSI